MKSITKTEAQKNANFEKQWSAAVDRLTLAHMTALLKAGKFSATEISRALSTPVR